MESKQNVLNVIKKYAFMAPIDLKDAFYSVPVSAHHQKYLKYFANENLKFTCMPNRYCPTMKIFTKITKVPFSVFRMQGHTSVVYVDDSYLQGDSYESCLKNVNDTTIMLRPLGLTIHPEKSVLKPTQKLIFLGFIVDSKDMILKLTEEKKPKIYHVCTKLFEKSKSTIRFLAQVISNIVASFPTVSLGPLFYTALETDNIVGLKSNRQNYDAEIKLSNEAYSELVWWKHNIKISFQDLVIPKSERIDLSCVLSTYLYGAFDCMFLLCHVRVSE